MFTIKVDIRVGKGIFKRETAISEKTEAERKEREEKGTQGRTKYTHSFHVTDFGEGFALAINAGTHCKLVKAKHYS